MKYFNQIVRPLTLALMLLATFPAQASAQECSPTQLGQLGGSGRDIAVEGNLAYVLRGENLVVLNISESTEPAVMRSMPISRFLYSIDLYGQIAYITSDDGLHVVDIEDPAHPTMVAQVDADGAIDAALHGTTLFVASVSEGLMLYDVSDPQDPELIDVPVITARADAIEIHGDIAFLVSLTFGVLILDVTNPLDLVVLSPIPLELGTETVVIAGDHLLAANGVQFRDTLTIIDIADPSQPEILATAVNGKIDDLAVFGTTAIALTLNGVQLIDFADPTSPVVRAAENVVNSRGRLALDNGLLYLTGSAALEVLQLADLLDPAIVGQAWPAASLPTVPALAIDGHLAYLASRSGFEIFDLSAPEVPTSMGFVDLSELVSSFTIDGGFAFVTSIDNSALTVIDISNPDTPVVVASVSVAGAARDVAIHSGYAFVGTFLAGLRVYDVQTPSNPVFIGALDSLGASRVTIDGDTAFVSDASTLSILNIDDPNDPLVISQLEVRDIGPNSVEVRDDVLYAATLNGVLHIYDVSDLSEPVALASITGLSEVTGLSFHNALALLPFGGGFHVLDVTNPGNPVVTNRIDLDARTIVTDENFAYIAEGCCFQPINVVDLSDIRQSPTIGVVESLNKTNLLVARGDIVYASERGVLYGLRIIDVSDPREPRVLASVDTFGQPKGIAMDDNVAYITDYTSLIAIDVTTPTSPFILGSVELPTGKIAVHDSIVYIVDESGLHIVDVSDPGSMTLIATVPTANDALDLDIYGGLVYVLEASVGLRVFDTSDPATPIELSLLPLNAPRSMDVDGSTAYISTLTPDGPVLTIVDISDPTNPMMINQPPSFKQAFAIAVTDGTAFLALGHDGLELIDVTVPQQAGSISVTRTRNWAYDVDVREGVAFVADSSWGMLAIDVSTCQINADCPADLTDDGPPGSPDDDVNVFDLLTLLQRWGLPGPGADLAAPEDRVDWLDVLELIENWGPCE